MSSSIAPGSGVSSRLPSGGWRRVARPRSARRASSGSGAEGSPAEAAKSGPGSVQTRAAGSTRLGSSRAATRTSIVHGACDPVAGTTSSAAGPGTSSKARPGSPSLNSVRYGPVRGRTVSRHRSSAAVIDRPCGHWSRPRAAASSATSASMSRSSTSTTATRAPSMSEISLSAARHAPGMAAASASMRASSPAPGAIDHRTGTLPSTVAPRRAVAGNVHAQRARSPAARRGRRTGCSSRAGRRVAPGAASSRRSASAGSRRTVGTRHDVHVMSPSSDPSHARVDGNGPACVGRERHGETRVSEWILGDLPGDRLDAHRPCSKRVLQATRLEQEGWFGPAPGPPLPRARPRPTDGCRAQSRARHARPPWRTWCPARTNPCAVRRHGVVRSRRQRACDTP